MEMQENLPKKWKSQVLQILSAEKKVILSPEETMERFMKRRDELDRIMDEKLAEIKSLLEVKG